MSSENSDSYLKLNKDQFNSWIDDFEQKYNKIEKNNTDSNELESLNSDSSYLENNVINSESNEDINNSESAESSNVFVKRKVFINRKPIIIRSSTEKSTETSIKNSKNLSIERSEETKIKNKKSLSIEKNKEPMKKNNENISISKSKRLLEKNNVAEQVYDNILSINLLNEIVNNLIENSNIKRGQIPEKKKIPKISKKVIDENKNNTINIALLKFVRMKKN